MMKSIILLVSVLFVYNVAKPQYSSGIQTELILKTGTTSIGQEIFYPEFNENEVTILKVTIPKGKSTGWHKHEFPVFAYILKGTLTVETDNNSVMQFSENSSFSEVINVYHRGINQGEEDLILIAFYLGGKDEELSVPKTMVPEK